MLAIASRVEAFLFCNQLCLYNANSDQKIIIVGVYMSTNIKKKLTKNMTEGSIAKALLAFTLPMLLSSVLQQLYSIADGIIVGNLVGEMAFAGIGSTTYIIYILTAFFIGLNMGASVIVSQYFGAGKTDDVAKSIRTAYGAFMLLAIPVTILGIVLARPLLLLLNTPDDGTLDYAATYLVTIMAGTVFTVGYNANSSIMRGLGDSRTPMYLLLIASVVNIALDLLFILVFDMGVFGVALATVIAQFISWITGVVIMNRRYEFVKVRLFPIQLDRDIVKKITKLGVPAALQSVLFFVGALSIQSLINSYGYEFMAGVGAAGKIDSFAFLPASALCTAITVFVGQNVGVGKKDRVKGGVRVGMLLTITINVVLCGAILLLAEPLLKLFISSADAIQAGKYYLYAIMPFYFLYGINSVYSGVIRGAGNSILPFIIAMVAMWIARVPAAYLLAYYAGEQYMFYSYPIGWALGFIISIVYYISGKWQKDTIVQPSTSTDGTSDSSTSQQ